MLNGKAKKDFITWALDNKKCNNPHVEYLVEVSKSITLTLDQFCEIVGKPRRRVYSLIDNKLLPEELICGGYENRKQKTKLLFHTERVIQWLKK